MTPLKTFVVYGTRPEAIKMAPVYLRLKQSPQFEPVLVATGQHRELAARALAAFDLAPDIDLDIMQPDQSPSEVVGRVIEKFGRLARERKPDVILVHGDTASTIGASIAAFLERIHVGHVEAGLRSSDKWAPFPEEINRQVTDIIADFYFAPTPLSRDNLIREGKPSASVIVTGNTVIDALNYITERLPAAGPSERKMILVTCHRRENFGKGIKNLCSAVSELVRRHPDADVVWPVHPNPNIYNVVHAQMSGIERVKLIDPPDYFQFVALMRDSYLLLSDSGGLQEEGLALKKPVLVLRDNSERPEAIDTGAAVLVGTNPDLILTHSGKLLTDKHAYEEMVSRENPFGDGKASARIADFLELRGRLLIQQ